MKRNSRIFFVSVVTVFVFCFFLRAFVSYASSGDNESSSVKQSKAEKEVSAIGNKVSEQTAGELDLTFSPVVNTAPGNARAAVVQSDGKIVVVGYFKTLNGISRRGIARLNTDNSIDQTFAADINGTIYAVALQSDGKIIIGGDFIAVGGVNRNRIARLNVDGSLDASFNPGTGADNMVYAVLVQPDGKILFSGSFYGVNSTANYLISRLNADGSLDTSFKSPFNLPLPPSPNALPNIIYSIALQASGKIILGGTPTFTSVSGSTVTFTAVARLNADGSNDSSFKAASFSSIVEKVVVQPDDKILIAGSFLSVNGVSRHFIARLNADGSLDASFDPGTGGNLPIHSIFLKPDGKILIGGDFSTFNGIQRSKIAELNSDGSLDTNFAASGGLLGGFQSVVGLPNGKALAVGGFQVFSNPSRDSIFIFNANGSLDASVAFTTTAIGGARTIASQSGSKFIIGGNFNRVAGLQRDYLARFNADGSLIGESYDNSFSSTSISGQVSSIVVQPDGKFLVAGFNLIIHITTGNSNGILVGGSIARFNADGSPDDSFTAGSIPSRRGINQIAVQPDGKIIVVYGYTLPNSLPTGGIARLNADGSLDNSFSGGIPAVSLNSVVLQPDGKILVGGEFSFSTVDSRTGSVSYNGVARLNADGSLDSTFVPATISDSAKFTNIYALALQAGGKILIGGSIFTNGRTTPTGAARLNADGSIDATFNSGAISGAFETTRVEDILPLPSGQILIGGLFNRIGDAAHNNIARLNADGTIDNSFNVSVDNTVYDIALQADGKVLIGGDFETVDGVPRTSVARLLSASETIRRALFDFDGDGKSDVSVYRPSNGVWYLLDSTAGFSATQFGISTDKIVPADYDGDGKTDIAVFRDGTWYLQRSTGGFAAIQFGSTGDIPVPADFNGDGKSELVVYRPSSGSWYALNLVNNAFTSTQFGVSEDKPVAADYDGDGKADYAVYRPSNGVWYMLKSRDGFSAVQFGVSTDKPVIGDYDGDGKADEAVYRPESGMWYLFQSTQGFAAVQFGISTDLPAPGDYDGDGKTDIAVFRPTSGTWYQIKSTQGFGAIQFGSNGDKPIPNGFVP